MIRLAEDLAVLRPLCRDSAFGCPIWSAAAAYGFDKSFVYFWTDDTAAYSLLDGVMRVCGTVTDAEEARAFMCAVGAKSVVCSRENAEALGLVITAQGEVLCKDLPDTQRVWREPPRLKPVYDVLASCDMVGAFEPFYLDLSHRVRHSAAAAFASPEQTPKAVSVALFGADCSLISAVAVRGESRRQGLGTEIVQKTENALGGRVYLLREENKNERFYASMGYRACGAWCAGNLE